jgi:hypothetical protein
MKQHQQSKYDALRRVQDYLDQHAEVVGTLNSSEGRKQLDASLVRLTTLLNEQGSAGLVMSGQASRARSLSTDLKVRHMRPIAAFARTRLRGVPDFAALTRPDSSLQGKALVHAARAMATAAAPYADALTKGGFPADTVAQLGTAATAMSEALVERANTKVGRVGATKGITESLRAGIEAVAMLHAVISKQFAADPTFLAGWHSARRVTAKPGAARGKAARTAAAAAAASAAEVTAVAGATPSAGATPVAVAAPTVTSIGSSTPLGSATSHAAAV